VRIVSWMVLSLDCDISTSFLTYDGVPVIALRPIVRTASILRHWLVEMNGAQAALFRVAVHAYNIYIRTRLKKKTSDDTRGAARVNTNDEKS